MKNINEINLGLVEGNTNVYSIKTVNKIKVKTKLNNEINNFVANSNLLLSLNIYEVPCGLLN